MENKYVEQNIDRLDIPCDVIDTLKKNNIKKLGQLSNTKIKDLRSWDLTTKDIEKINTELGTLGLSLKWEF